MPKTDPKKGKKKVSSKYSADAVEAEDPVVRRGMTYGQMTVAWGKARTAFIRAQMKRGRPKSMAESNWETARKTLKARGVNYPPSWLHGGVYNLDTPEEEAVKNKQNQLLIDKQKAQQAKEDNEKAERIKKAKEQQAKFLEQYEKGPDGKLIAKKRPGGDLDETDPQIAGGSADVLGPPPKKKKQLQINIPELYKRKYTYRKGKGKGKKTTTTEADIINQEGEAVDQIEVPGEDWETLDEAEINDIFAEELYEAEQTPLPALTTEEATTAGNNVPAPHQGGGEDEAMEEAGGGPGMVDNMGGGGGGLAGAGNNQYHHGFAKSTQPRNPPDYSYVDTYRRPFQVHTQFPDPAIPAAYIYNVATQQTDREVSGPLGYQTSQLWGVVNHTGIFIPYWFQEASMKICDWNKPENHVAWKVEEFGFDCPNMRLNILNNAKDNPNDVAPAPPADARMWMFVDTFNDYGIPRAYNADQVAHNEYFKMEDINTVDVTQFELPKVGKRWFPLDPQVAHAILAGREWSADGNTWVTNDSHALYDMKRHPGYHEFILSEASFGTSYKCTGPIIRFPHPGIQSIDGLMRVSGAFTTSTSGINRVTQWPSFQKQELLQQQDDISGTVANATLNELAQKQNEVQYYIANQSAIFDDMRDNETASASYNAGVDQWASYSVRPPGNAAVVGQAPLAKLRTVGRNDVSDDGMIHRTHISKRPPLFIIGLYKELEYREIPKFWRYYLYGQVNYWCKIRWYVQPNRTKTYIPIGLGGVYTTAEESGASHADRREIINSRYKYRYTMKPMLNSTAYDNSVFSANRGNIVT